MNARLAALAQSIRNTFGGLARRAAGPLDKAAGAARAVRAPSRRSLLAALALALAVLGAWALMIHPPLQAVDNGEVAVRTNQLTGSVAEFRDGPILALPGLHVVRIFSLRDRIYRPREGRRAEGEAAFQSVEGLSLGVDLTVRYAIDPSRIAQIARSLPPEIDAAVVEPAVQGIVYRVFSRYTVREIFSGKRSEIQQAIEAELKARLAGDGLLVRGVQFGKVDLPPDYRQGMERLLAEELETEKMRYTLELKEKRVKQTELEAQADKVRRETAAAAAGAEQVIAAKAQEEAMRHVLPLRQKQIEQRRLEAEADKLARVKNAEASSQARQIEATGEAASREKLADAEVYRLEKVGLATSAQMAREGELITRHPLLIQKTVADKLSDKVQVIIAPPGTDGRFIASHLIGSAAVAPAPRKEQP
jgi:regulator of protease activity HflC (stomatin/prohibitin superfamily)